MAEDPETTSPADPQQAYPHARRRGFLRRIVFPVLVIVAIAGVIWYLENRDDGEVSSTGEEFGPRPLPTALVPEGAEVGREEGKLAPDFLLETLEGGELRLSDYRGEAVILNFWATWCGPCKREMPLFVDAYRQYKSEGLVIIAVNEQEGRSIIEPFASDFGMNFPIALDRDSEVGDQYRILGLPTTYFIGRDGVIRSLYIGQFESEERGTNVQSAIEGSELEARIQEILGSGSTGAAQ